MKTFLWLIWNTLIFPAGNFYSLYKNYDKKNLLALAFQWLSVLCGTVLATMVIVFSIIGTDFTNFIPDYKYIVPIILLAAITNTLSRFAGGLGAAYLFKDARKRQNLTEDNIKIEFSSLLSQALQFALYGKITNFDEQKNDLISTPPTISFRKFWDFFLLPILMSAICLLGALGIFYISDGFGLATSNGILIGNFSLFISPFVSIAFIALMVSIFTTTVIRSFKGYAIETDIIDGFNAALAGKKILKKWKKLDKFTDINLIERHHLEERFSAALMKHSRSIHKLLKLQENLIEYKDAKKTKSLLRKLNKVGLITGLKYNDIEIGVDTDSMTADKENLTSFLKNTGAINSTDNIKNKITRKKLYEIFKKITKSTTIDPTYKKPFNNNLEKFGLPILSASSLIACVYIFFKICTGTISLEGAAWALPTAILCGFISWLAARKYNSHSSTAHYGELTAYSGTALIIFISLGFLSSFSTSLLSHSSWGITATILSLIFFLSLFAALKYAKSNDKKTLRNSQIFKRTSNFLKLFKIGLIFISLTLVYLSLGNIFKLIFFPLNGTSSVMDYSINIANSLTSGFVGEQWLIIFSIGILAFSIFLILMVSKDLLKASLTNAGELKKRSEILKLLRQLFKLILTVGLLLVIWSMPCVFIMQENANLTLLPAFFVIAFVFPLLAGNANLPWFHNLNDRLSHLIGVKPLLGPGRIKRYLLREFGVLILLFSIGCAVINPLKISNLAVIILSVGSLVTMAFRMHRLAVDYNNPTLLIPAWVNKHTRTFKPSNSFAAILNKKKSKPFLYEENFDVRKRFTSKRNSYFFSKTSQNAVAPIPPVKNYSRTSNSLSGLDL